MNENKVNLYLDVKKWLYISSRIGKGTRALLPHYRVNIHGMDFNCTSAIVNTAGYGSLSEHTNFGL